MINLEDPEDIKRLKEAFEYSFKGPLGETTMEFLEEFCGFWKGGPVTGEAMEDHMLQYERGKRDVILTLKTIKSEDWTPQQIAKTYKRS